MRPGRCWRAGGNNAACRLLPLPPLTTYAGPEIGRFPNFWRPANSAAIRRPRRTRPRAKPSWPTSNVSSPRATRRWSATLASGTSSRPKARALRHRPGQGGAGRRTGPLIELGERRPTGKAEQTAGSPALGRAGAARPSMPGPRAGPPVRPAPVHGSPRSWSRAAAQRGRSSRPTCSTGPIETLLFRPRTAPFWLRRGGLSQETGSRCKSALRAAWLKRSRSQPALGVARSSRPEVPGEGRTDQPLESDRPSSRRGRRRA